jgi:anaerobic selenocysteine-containing dehydrogenase
VARYAERVHHPERLTQPLLRTGPRDSGQFRPIGWDEALDRVAEALAEAAQRDGGEAVWPYHSAGTMGLVNRDGINRLTHVLRYSGERTTFCTAIANAGWAAGVGRLLGPDPREMARSDLIVVWGGNPVSTQVNVMTHISRARKQRGARLVVIDPYRTGTAQVADQHLALRPGTDAALACAVMHVAFRDGFADRDYMARYADQPQALEAHLVERGPTWAAGITGLSVAEIEAFARLYGATPRSYIRLGTEPARRHLPADRHRRLAARRRRRVLEPRRHLSLGQDPHRGPGRPGPGCARARSEPHRRGAHRRARGAGRRPGRACAVHPEQQPGRRRAEQQQGAARPAARGFVRGGT